MHRNVEQRVSTVGKLNYLYYSAAGEGNTQSTNEEQHFFLFCKNDKMTDGFACPIPPLSKYSVR